LLIPDCGGFIYVHRTGGIDEETCGSFVSPCSSIIYAVDLAIETSIVYVLVDLNYYTLKEAFVFPHKLFSIIGVNEYGNLTSVEFPTFFYSFQNEYFFAFVSPNTQAVISNLTIYIDGQKSSYGKYVVYHNASGGVGYVNFRYLNVCFWSDVSFFFFEKKLFIYLFI
jgi:hypothetical protein